MEFLPGRELQKVSDINISDKIIKFIIQDEINFDQVMNYLGLLKRNFLIACQLDVQTLKPGNVSFNSSGFSMIAKIL